MTYPAKARYDHFNKLLFDGELPDIPIKMVPMKGVSGRAIARGRRLGPGRLEIVPGSLEIHLDTKWKRTDEETDKTLVHEMIHVRLYIMGIREAHGPRFRAMASELSGRAGFRIPLHERVAKAELEDDVPDAPVGVLVVKFGHDLTYALMAPKALRQRLDELTKYFKERPVLAAIVTSRYWTTRAFGRKVQSRVKPVDVGFYRLDPAGLDDLRTNGETLHDSLGTSKVAAALRAVAAHLLR